MNAAKYWQQKQKVKHLPVKKVEMKESELVKVINDAIIEDRKKTVNRLYAVFALTLHDMHNFGKERLQKTLMKTSKHFECIQDGLVSEEEIQEEIAKFDIFIK
jgi:hypothetical protein